MRFPRKRHTARVGAVLAVLGALLVAATPAGATGGGHGHGGRATVVQEGLSSPKGLTAFWGVAPIIGQGAFGPPPGPVLLSVRPGKTVPLSRPTSCVDIALTSDYALWCLSSAETTYGQLFRQTWKSHGWQFVANIPEYQVTDPDHDTQDGNPEESNPYGLATLGKDVLVADAAGNDLLRVNRHGGIKTVARFAPELVSTDHLDPYEFPGLPPAIPAESVPTSIAVTGDGIYVGELKGFPFRPGSSNIYKIDLDAEGASCSATPNAECRVVQEDLTAIQDIAIDRWTGKTYVYELAEEGTFAFEAGFETGDFPPAVLLEINRGHRRELARGQLSEPGGVIAAFGKVHVTDGVFSEGRLLRIG